MMEEVSIGFCSVIEQFLAACWGSRSFILPVQHQDCWMSRGCGVETLGSISGDVPGGCATTGSVRTLGWKTWLGLVGKA